MSRTTQAFDAWHQGLKPSARSPVFAGVFAIVLGLGGGGYWAATAQLDSAAVAPGVVVAAGQNKVIQHLEGGIIEEILVSEGQIVTAGQILVSEATLGRLGGKFQVEQLPATQLKGKERPFAVYNVVGTHPAVQVPATYGA